jgi:transposase
VASPPEVRRLLWPSLSASTFTADRSPFDALDGATGEVTTGRIAPADRAGLRRFLERWDGQQVEAAVEATTGLRFVVEELQRAGAAAFLAEPAETSARRGPKRRAQDR